MQPGRDTERAALLADDVDTDGAFRKALDAELDKITSFYTKKEAELLQEVLQLLNDAEEYADSGDEENLRPKSSGRPGLSRWDSNQGNDDDDSDDDDEEDDDRVSGAGSRLLKPQNQHMRHSITSDAPSDPSARRRHSIAFSDDVGENPSTLLYDKRITLKKRAISLFVALRELKSYSQLNKTGFTKALKKYDKILQRKLKARYIEQCVAPAYCFQEATIRNLDENVNKIEGIYADLVTNGDLAEAKKELRLHLREHVVWERNTVWRDMIGIERKTHAAHLGLTGPLLGDQVEKRRLAGDEAIVAPPRKLLWTPCGTMAVPTWLFSMGFFVLTGIVLIFAAMLQMTIFETPEQNNCFAMLVFVSLLWATEVCAYSGGGFDC